MSNDVLVVLDPNVINVFCLSSLLNSLLEICWVNVVKRHFQLIYNDLDSFVKRILLWQVEEWNVTILMYDYWTWIILFHSDFYEKHNKQSDIIFINWPNCAKSLMNESLKKRLNFAK